MYFENIGCKFQKNKIDCKKEVYEIIFIVNIIASEIRKNKSI